MSKITAKIVADSVCPKGHRLTTFLITFPRYILAELNTHRMLSKNSASSRAIPFEKLLKSVEENPFIPVAWMKNHSGMQGAEYFNSNDGDVNRLISGWLFARDNAVENAKFLSDYNLTKQMINRILEPYMWHTVLISGTEWENFFTLRCPQYALTNSDKTYRSRKDFIKDNSALGQDYSDMTDLDWRKCNKGMADIHMMDLAECMWDVYNESKPKQLKGGDWHIPFGDDINEEELVQISPYFHKNNVGIVSSEITDNEKWIKNTKVKIATARCARTSYTVVGEEKKQSLEADIKLHDKFLKQKPLHASPFEHCAKVMTTLEYIQHIYRTGNDNNILSNEEGWCKNYRGFIQYRAMLENENVEQPLYKS